MRGRFGVNELVGVLAVVVLLVVSVAHWWSVSREDGQSYDSADGARAMITTSGVDEDASVLGARNNDPVCQLLQLAAAADPSLQRAASRSASDIDDTAALQQQLFEAAADRVGDDEEAMLLRSLATAFAPTSVEGGAARTAGSWTDEEWADALIRRATLDNGQVLTEWEARCP